MALLRYHVKGVNNGGERSSLLGPVIFRSTPEVGLFEVT